MCLLVQAQDEQDTLTYRRGATGGSWSFVICKQPAQSVQNETGGACSMHGKKIVFQKPEGKRSRGIPKHGCADNIKKNCEQI
jgi:hypothetical protein